VTYLGRVRRSLPEAASYISVVRVKRASTMSAIWSLPPTASIQESISSTARASFEADGLWPSDPEGVSAKATPRATAPKMRGTSRRTNDLMFPPYGWRRRENGQSVITAGSPLTLYVLVLLPLCASRRVQNSTDVWFGSDNEAPFGLILWTFRWAFRDIVLRPGRTKRRDLSAPHKCSSGCEYRLDAAP
jgi:hypothetical protein